MRAALVLLLLLAGCSGVDYSKGHVRAIEVEPRDPAAGQRVHVLLELYDPYIYPGIEGVGPVVNASVDGGTLEGRQWSSPLGEEGHWVNVQGDSITSAPSVIFWELPDEPGTYKITVTFDGDTMTRRVVGE